MTNTVIRPVIGGNVVSANGYGSPGLEIGPVPVFVDGVPHDERAGEAAKVLGEKTVTIVVNLGTGEQHEFTMWTCDFSAEYVKINAAYRT
jgi:glutamate N-acetyltransferase/amino-acid N-acetyltransferase